MEIKEIPLTNIEKRILFDDKIKEIKMNIYNRNNNQEETDDSLPIYLQMYIHEENIKYMKQYYETNKPLQCFSWGLFYDYDSSPINQFYQVKNNNYN